jgi:hypothetical protein
MPIHHKGSGNKKSLDRLRLTTARMPVYVWDESDIGEFRKGFCFLGDLSPKGAGVYLADKIHPGHPVRIGFDRPDAVTFRGVVAWASRFSLEQRYFSSGYLPHRLGIKLQFGSEAERQRFLAFLEEKTEKILAVRPGLRF